MKPTPERQEAHALSLVARHQGLIAVLVLALAVRLSGLGEWWLNPDEGIYYSILTRESFSGFWDEVASNAHPPLYYLFLRGMGAIAWDFLWFRAFTVLCGLAAVWTAWAVARSLAGSGARGTVAGLIAALAVAVAPGAVELSQVMRPYMLQVALLGGALFFLLRYLEGSRASDGSEPDMEGAAPDPVLPGVGGRRDLAAYLVLVLLALLTHYSSMLALGAFGLVIVHDGLAHGTGRAPWRRVFAAHVLPGLVLALVYLVHLRPLMSSELADEALDGWLGPYMIDAPRDAWLAFLGFQHLLAQPWLRGFTALATLMALAASAFRRPGPEGVDGRRPAVLIASGFLIAIAAASLGVYPLGATRHSAWLLVFVVPALGWFGAHVLSRSGRSALVWGGALSLLVLMSGPIGDAIGGPYAPWAPNDRVLREESLTQVVDVLDPSASPELVVMSAQTFYLLLPFYPVEREAAVRSADGHLFHFRLGARRVLVSESWDFTAGPDRTVQSDLAGTLSAAARAFPELSLDQTAQAVLVIGGWRPPVVDRLVTASAEGARPFLVSAQSVPGFYAFLLDVPAVREAFEP